MGWQVFKALSKVGTLDRIQSSIAIEIKARQQSTSGGLPSALLKSGERGFLGLRCSVELARDFAWRLFQRRLGRRFIKRNLSALLGHHTPLHHMPTIQL